MQSTLNLFRHHPNVVITLLNQQYYLCFKASSSRVDEDAHLRGHRRNKNKSLGVNEDWCVDNGISHKRCWIHLFLNLFNAFMYVGGLSASVSKGFRSSTKLILAATTASRHGEGTFSAMSISRRVMVNPLWYVSPE
jgi:hypothetical protein